MDPQRVTRILDVIGHLAETGPRSVTAIARDLDIPVSSAHDLVRALAGAGAVSPVGRAFALGPRAYALGVRITEGVTVRDVARRHLAELVERIELDVYLAVRLGDRVMYVDRYEGTQRVGIDIKLGRSLFLHSTAVGKLFAAHHRDLRETLLAAPRPRLTDATLTSAEDVETELERVARDGLSVSREESVEGVIGLGAPVWGPRGVLVAAVHVSALRGQLGPENFRPTGEALKETAAAIGRDLGAEPATT